MAAVVAEVDSRFVGMFFRLRRALASLGHARTPAAGLSGGAIAWGRRRDPASGIPGSRTGRNR